MSKQRNSEKPSSGDTNRSPGKSGTSGPTRLSEDRQAERPSSVSPPRKVTFDDFQIQRAEQAARVEEEKRAWQERVQREEEKGGFFKNVVPRLRSRKEENIGNKNPFAFLFGQKPRVEEEEQPVQSTAVPPEYRAADQPYFAEHERLGIRISRREEAEKQAAREREELLHARLEHRDRDSQYIVHEELDEETIREEDKRLIEAFYEDEVSEKVDVVEFQERYDEELLEEELLEEELLEEELLEEAAVEAGYEEDTEALTEEEEEALREEEELDILEAEEEARYQAEERALIEAEAKHTSQSHDQLEALHASEHQMEPISETPPSPRPKSAPIVQDEPDIEPALRPYLDQLRAFDSHPRRATEPRDPRADFVILLKEQLQILREQVDATSAIFFWINQKKQQIVMETSALSDEAFMYISKEKRFPIDFDAVSTVVTRKKPELHSTISPQAELDLIPYYTDTIGIASFAGMPVLFGEGLVAVLTVDSTTEDKFSPETLRILTAHSRLISGLIKSYIEKYDLLGSARTLESARRLHHLVSPDSAFRVLRDQRRTPEYILRALTEAVSEIIDWEWLSTASFDETRRTWCVSSLQSKNSLNYVPPQTPIAMNESLVGRCLQTGRSARIDALTEQNIRFATEEDRGGVAGHSFVVIAIRTSSKNYGALTIEHREAGRYTDADVETLEHLTRSAAAVLEIMALSEIVNDRALTDLLTGVYNKRGLHQRLNEELARAMEFDEPLTLVLFEIDGASEFMARFAQEDSDSIILAVTRLLQFGGRTFDVMARVGEHAFAALMIKMNDEEGYLWSEKMRKMIVSEVIAIGRRSFSVTVSVGVSGARRDGTVEELIEGAELAIERAKELGGNNVIVF